MEICRAAASCCSWRTSAEDGSCAAATSSDTRALYTPLLGLRQAESSTATTGCSAARAEGSAPWKRTSKNAAVVACSVRSAWPCIC